MHFKPRYYLPLLAIAGLLSTGMARAQSVPEKTLAASRKIIDSLDKELINIIGKRERVVKSIGIYKAKNHIAPLQAARFKEVLDRGIIAGARQGLSAEFITKLLNAIHDESLRIERDSTLTKQ